MQAFSLHNFFDAIYATFCSTFLYLLWLWNNIFNAYRYIHIMSFLNVFDILQFMWKGKLRLCAFLCNYNPDVHSCIFCIFRFLNDICIVSMVIVYLASSSSLKSSYITSLAQPHLLYMFALKQKLYDGISDNDNTFTVFTCSIFKIMVDVHLAQCILKDSFPSSFVWSGKKIVKNILLMARIKVCYFIVRY